MTVILRGVKDDDLPIFFQQQLDPEANYMAAFTSENPEDREAFEAHWLKIRNSETVLLKTILSDGEVAGYLAKFKRDDDTEVSYWIGREFWGRGIATSALKLLQQIVEERPLYARVAQDNIGSIRVLEKSGFQRIGEDRYLANARGMEIGEYIYQLGE